MARDRRRGQALVELAIACPIFLAFLIGTVDVGWLYHHQLVLTNAAREGARLGALGLSDNDVRARVVAYMADAGYTPALAASDMEAGAGGGAYRVALRSTVPCLFAASGPPLTLQAVSHMRLE